MRLRSNAPMSTVSAVFFYGLFVAATLLCLVLGVKNFFDERVFLAHAELDTGTIVRYELHVRNDGKSEYCPRIEFTDRAGEPVAVAGGDCPSAPDKTQIGKKVQVYYDPNNPDAYEEKSPTTGFDGLIFGLIGTVFFGLFWFLPLLRAILHRLFPDVRLFGARASGRSSGAMNDTLRQDAERYRANQAARARAEKAGQPYYPPTPSAPTSAQPAPGAAADEAARLAQLQRQADALQRQIDELKRTKGQ